MDMNLLTYLACICFLFLFGKLFLVPIKKVLKLIFNSIFGGGIIWIINTISVNFGFTIGINIFTSLVVGLLGLPGTVCLILVRLMV